MERVSTTRATWILTGVILVATLARLNLGFVFFGFHTGDDVEILQAGFMRALSWPYQPWEIRNLLVSDVLVAPVIGLLSALGVTSVRTLVWLATWPFVLLASLNLWLVYRLTLGWLDRRGAALVASGLYALHWMALGYGSTVYPRTASTTFVLLAALTLLHGRNSTMRPLLAGGLVGIAWAIRYSEAIFLLPLLGTLWLTRGNLRSGIRGCSALVLGFAGVSLFTVGLEDCLTWGRPFASILALARYTFLERQASSLVPHQPWYWYFWRLPKWLPITLLPLLWQARKVAGSLIVSLYILLPLVTLSAVHHKQLRYLQGIVPFVFILAAGGAWALWRSGRHRAVTVLVVLSAVLGLGGISFLAKGSMPAVLAARHLHQSSVTGPICLSQSWAYGSNLYLGPTAIVRDLPYPLTSTELAGRLSQCNALGLYRDDYRRDPGFAAELERQGWALDGEYRRSRGKPVLVFKRLSGTGT